MVGIIQRIRKKYKPLWLIVAIAALVALAAGVGVWRQNDVALHELHTAQQQDASGKIAAAKATLGHVSLFLVFGHVRQQIKDELRHNQQLADANSKIAQAQQLLKEHKTAQALALLNTLQPGASSPGVQAQVNALKSTAQQTKASTGGGTSAPAKGTSGGGASGGGSAPGAGGGSGTGSGSGGSGGSGGSSGGGTPPPGPMSTIAIAAFSATSSAYNASSCRISQSVTFTTNGTGTVTVTWKILSTKSSSSIDNPVTYSFTAAGSQTDSLTSTMQGLEPGDSYHVSVTMADTSDGTVTAVGGPATITSCASPPALLAAQQPSFMTHITPGSIRVSQSQDGLFSNECSMNLIAPFSVDGSGSVEAVYTLTSGSSGGATLYAIQTEDFSGAGSSQDSSYIRMPHLNSGDGYSVSVKLVDVGNQSVFATFGPVTSGCS